MFSNFQLGRFEDITKLLKPVLGGENSPAIVAFSGIQGQYAVDNAVMETIDPEIAETCKDLGAVKKLFYAPIGSTGDALSDTGPRKPDATRHPTNNTASLDPTDTSSMKPSM
ncbi:hypothetical protein V6N13_057936 [Hibiscus sabdariffa]